jgi:hypothetical protein
LSAEKGIFTKEEFLERVGLVNEEMNRKRRKNARGVTYG